MDDWRNFVEAQPQSLLDEVALERSAEELIAKLEGFGQNLSARVEDNENRPPHATVKPPAAKGGLKDAPPSPVVSLKDVNQPRRRTNGIRPPRRSSIGSDAGASTCSEASDVSSRSGRAASRLYESARARQAEHLARSSSPAPAEIHRPTINEHSKELVGDRSASEAGSRLHEQGKAAAAKRKMAIEEAEQRAAEELLEQRDAVPEINGVSAQLAAGREGTAAERLYAFGLDKDRRQAERNLEEARAASAKARPALSHGTARIAAELPGREQPVQDRLYAEASERQENAMRRQRESMMVGADEGVPAICETSRRIAERANAGVPLHERLASRTGSCPARPPSMPQELVECVHAPAINAKSERLAVCMQAKSWANGQIAVEDRLIAAAPVRQEAVVEDQQPTINPHSEEILLRRGPIAPLDERLQRSGTAKMRGGVGTEVENCTLRPEISEGSKRMLAKRGQRAGSVVDRLQAWGSQHKRGDGDASLSDRRFKFGPDPDEKREEEKRQTRPNPVGPTRARPPTEAARVV